MNNKSLGTFIIIIAAIVIGLLILAPLTNSIFSLIVSLVIWAFTGWLVGKLVKQDFSLLVDIAIGLVGGVIGSFLFNLLRLGWVNDIWLVGNIFVGVIGGLIAFYVYRAFASRRQAA